MAQRTSLEGAVAGRGVSLGEWGKHDSAALPRMPRTAGALPQAGQLLLEPLHWHGLSSVNVTHIQACPAAVFPHHIPPFWLATPPGILFPTSIRLPGLRKEPLSTGGFGRWAGLVWLPLYEEKSHRNCNVMASNTELSSEQAENRRQEHGGSYPLGLPTPLTPRPPRRGSSGCHLIFSASYPLLFLFSVESI